MEQIDISRFVGSDQVEHKIVQCNGEPTEFRSIVQRSIAFVRAYSDTIGRGDFAEAFALTDSSLRDRMTLEQFEKVHQQAETEFRGPALEYRIERFVHVLADDAARNDKKDKGWRKDIPCERRRSRILSFWIRNRERNSGCRGRFGITEENGEYRVADFDFYRD